ncbi:MAG TPA: ABC transporter ATP-binding protein [Pyrinomonadaceae bacterium]|nr:ABC transporter ATP-binding protein [Pyrinomonadaceae bacterium]
MIEAPPKLELIDLLLRYPVSRTLATDRDVDPGLAVDLRGTHNAPPIHISAGEFTILLGPSGCGKSSLLQMIAGVVKPTEGVVLKDGVAVANAGRDRGMVFQSYTSFPWLTVEENVLFGLKLRKSELGKNEKRAKVHEIVNLVGLSDSLHKYPKELSGGMKQRVAIARALANDPDVLLMDEPFGALDPHIRIKMQELMLEVERRLSTTIVFVTHDAREAVFLGDTIYISTIRPCFLKYRYTHPFEKENIPRELARERYSKDFLSFQREVEDRMQYLIEQPETPRVVEQGDYLTLKRSMLGFLEELTEGI